MFPALIKIKEIACLGLTHGAERSGEFDISRWVCITTSLVFGLIGRDLFRYMCIPSHSVAACGSLKMLCSKTSEDADSVDGGIPATFGNAD